MSAKILTDNRCSVDDVASFLSFPEFTRGASAAVIAPEYRLRAQNLQATVSEDLMEYSLGQRNLKAYDLQECAGLCDSMPGCKAFNLCKNPPTPDYFYYDASLNKKIH